MMGEPGYYVSVNDRILRLRSGRLLHPLAIHGRTYEPHGVCSCWYSDDEGGSWQQAAARIDLPMRGAMEPACVELQDGRVLMVLRTQLGRLYQSISEDEGAHWCEARPMALVSTEAPAAIKRIPETSDLLVVWNRNYEPAERHMGRRNPLSTAMSRDEGETWEDTGDLESSEGFNSSYPSVFFGGEEAFFVYYHENRETGYTSLKLKILPLSWFTSS
jgi:sialidase-1